MEFLVLCALVGLIPAAIAHRKGRSFGAWWFYGAMLLIVALPHALVLKPDQAALERKQRDQGMKKCPFCAEMVMGDAIVCRYCGKDLPAAAAAPPPPPRPRCERCGRAHDGPCPSPEAPRKIFWTITGLVLLALIIAAFVIAARIAGSSGSSSTTTTTAATPAAPTPPKPAEVPYSTYTTADNLLLEPCSGKGQQVILKTDPLTHGSWSTPSLVFDHALSPNAALYRVQTLNESYLLNGNTQLLLDRTFRPPVQTAGELAVLLESAEQSPPTPKSYWKVRLVGGVDTSDDGGWGLRIPVVKFDGYPEGKDLSHLDSLDLFRSPNDYSPCKVSLSGFPEAVSSSVHKPEPETSQQSQATTMQPEAEEAAEREAEDKNCPQGKLALVNRQTYYFGNYDNFVHVLEIAPTLNGNQEPLKAMAMSIPKGGLVRIEQGRTVKRNGVFFPACRVRIEDADVANASIGQDVWIQPRKLNFLPDRVYEVGSKLTVSAAAHLYRTREGLIEHRADYQKLIEADADGNWDRLQKVALTWANGLESAGVIAGWGQGETVEVLDRIQIGKWIGYQVKATPWQSEKEELVWVGDDDVYLSDQDLEGARRDATG